MSKLHLGLNFPIKLNETLIDFCVCFFRFLEPSEASFYDSLLAGDQVSDGLS